MESRLCYDNGGFGAVACAEKCPGSLSKGVPDGEGGEGYFVQLCRNPETIGQGVGGMVFCGNGPDVLVFHQTEFPSMEEIMIEARDL